MTDALVTKTTPALRFFARGQQLQRLQEHVLASMMNQLDQDYTAFKHVDVTDSATAVKAAGLAMHSVARGQERFADIQLMLQLFFCRHVDNFQSFIEETLRATFAAQPGLLKRNDVVTAAQVLVHSTIQSFVQELAEQRIQKLAYKGFRDLVSVVKEELKFPLVKDEKELAELDLAFGIRNLVTHNYGVVNRIFLSKFPAVVVPLEEPYPVDAQKIAANVKLLIEKARDIESRAVQKFKINYTSHN
jgi:hypothetical protein